MINELYTFIGFNSRHLRFRFWEHFIKGTVSIKEAWIQTAIGTVLAYIIIELKLIA